MNSLGQLTVAVVMAATLLAVTAHTHADVPGCHACQPGQQCCGPTSWAPACYWPQNETCCASAESLVTICHSGDSCCPTWGPPQMYHCCSNSTTCCGGGGDAQFGACCRKGTVCCAQDAAVCCPEDKGCGTQPSTCG